MPEYISGKPWWKEQASFRDKKAVVKLYNEDGSFLTSIHIPTVYWPLNGPYEVFTYENTCCIADDPKAMELFDSLTYLIGHCYQNTEQLVEAFHKAGYSIKPYCGWAFVNETTPVHHCWAVLSDKDNHKAVLDLSCDSVQMWRWLASSEANTPACHSMEKAKERIVDWISYALKNMTHTQRCEPVGIVPPTHLYIGSECEPQSGIALYHKLTTQHPRHISIRNVNASGYNRTQWMLKQRGLMK